MKTLKILLLISVLFSQNVFSAVVELTETQSITDAGQLFNFNFSPLPASDGSGGQFLITLSGDYSPRTAPPLSEGSTVSLDIASGTVELYNSNHTAAIFSNTVVGLTLNSTSFSGGGNDVTLGYVFDMSAVLLDSIIADTLFSISVQNTDDVNYFFGGSVEVGIIYESSAVPIPAAVWLFGSGLGLLGWMRRKQAT